MAQRELWGVQGYAVERAVVGRSHREDAEAEADPEPVSDSRHEEIRRACQDFHQRHPECWRLFERFALEKAGLGCDHFGAQAVFERIRWETSRGGNEPELKLNNNFAPFYGRRFNRLHPELGDGEFFRERRQTSRAAKATGRGERSAPASE